MLRRPIVFLPLVAVAVLAGIPLGAEAYVRARVLPKLSARLGRAVSVSDVKIGLGTVALSSFVVDGGDGPAPLVAKSVTARLRLSSLLRGRVHVSTVTLVEPRVDLVRSGSGDDNISTLLDNLRSKKPSAGADPGRAAGLGGVTVDTVVVVGGSARVFDDALGRAEVKSLDGELALDGPATLRLVAARADVVGAHAGAKEATFEATLAHGRPAGLVTVDVTGASLTPFPGLDLTGIHARVRPDPDGERQQIDVRGSYGGADAELWNAVGWLAADRKEGKLTLRCDRFKLSQLDAVLRNKDGTPELVNASRGEMDAHLDLGFKDDRLAFIGGTHLAGLTVAHSALAAVPVPRLGFDVRVRGMVDTRAHTLKLAEAAFDFRNLRARVVANVENLGPKPRFDARLTIDSLPCQVALEALPKELVPYLQGFVLTGTFSTDLHGAVDLEDLDTPVDLGGHVGIEGCKVKSAPAWASAERLSATFEQTVEYEHGKWMTFLVGPESPDWVPFAELSPHLINSIMTTEDSGFFKHHGFISSEFRSALQQNLQRGYFRLGASSITMQMVKNVLLSREKTLSRKLQEMFLTWYLEHHLDKERIMEIYFNVIEFGPGIYGIGHAARHYFGKSAKELAPEEAAWFSSILPNPKKRYVQYCHKDGLPDAKWDAYVKRIMRRMHERGRLSDEDYEAAVARGLHFSRAEAMPEKECIAYVKRITTPLQELAQTK